MTLQRRVLGYHSSGAAVPSTYRWDLLSTISYDGYEVDPATGSYRTLHDWDKTALVATAQSHGVKVLLMTYGHSTSELVTVLTDANKRKKLVETLVATVQSRGGDGVDVDYEMLPKSMRAPFTQFMTELRAALTSAMPGALLTAALPAWNWIDSYDMAALSTLCDQMMIMGYDYSFLGSTVAGPVAPLGGAIPNVTKSVDTYLGLNVPPSKLLLGVPYYGYDWQTTSKSAHAAVVPGSQTHVRTYSQNVPKAQASGRQWDATAESPWYAYDDAGQSRVCWYEDEVSLAAKYQLVASRNLAGIGIWTLGYQGDRPELWQAIETAFT